MSKSFTAPTAAVVREFLRDETRFGSLSPEAQATVREGARGRLHKEAIKRYNKGRKADRQYVLGAGTVANAERKAQRSALVAKGLAGTRGPLSKAAQVSVLSKD